MRRGRPTTLKAADYRAVIQILTNPATVDDYNVPLTSYTVEWNLRAAYVPQTVVSKFTQGETSTIDRTLFRIRRDPGINNGHVLKYNNEFYTIKGIQKIGLGVEQPYSEIMTEKIL